MVAVIGNKNLGFCLKSAERFSVDNSVSVTLERGAGLILRFFVKTAQALCTVHGVWCEGELVLDEVFFEFQAVRILTVD